MDDLERPQLGDVIDSPVAIVGMACRFPMAPSPSAFWRLLRAGADAITDAPPARRADNIFYDSAAKPDRAAASAHRAGFLDRIDEFDADFFGISPREARELDPQQRLMLELAWEVLEDARIAPDSAAGSQTGVYLGTIADDYAALVHERGLESVTGHTMTGLHRSFIANRVSYALGLRGPSLTVDTGQSSSLVAVHLACASLRRGECAVAMAGGVHLNIAAQSTMQVLRLGALSPAGSCAVFDASADGFVRGEGAGAVAAEAAGQGARRRRPGVLRHPGQRRQQRRRHLGQPGRARRARAARGAARRLPAGRGPGDQRPVR